MLSLTDIVLGALWLWLWLGRLLSWLKKLLLDEDRFRKLRFRKSWCEVIKF